MESAWFVTAAVLTVLVIGVVVMITLPPRGPSLAQFWVATVGLYLFMAALRATIGAIEARKKPH